MSEFTSGIKVLEATLLSSKEADTLLTPEDKRYCGNWWLKSPGAVSYCAATMCKCGSLDKLGSRVDFGAHYIRPALRIDTSNSDAKVGDLFAFGGRKFKVISSELAFIYNDDIGYCAFRKDWSIKNSTKYEASDIRRFVDAWFEGVKTSE